MNINSIVLRLKLTEYKYSEAKRIKEEIDRLPFAQKIKIITELRIESNKSDNSEIIDVINDIINETKSK